MNRPLHLPLPLPLLTAALLTYWLLAPSPARAWYRFHGGCQTCHPFTVTPYTPPGGGAAWPASLHDVHSDAAYMNADCDLCHRPEDQGNPWLTWSVGAGGAPPVGCMGCHGRMVTGSLPSSSGLLNVHRTAGGGCDTCHDAFIYPPAAPESVNPPYYGLGVSNVGDPCNGDASEDWSGDGLGLDNDGDGLTDSADPECSPPLCGDGVVQSGERCDGMNLWGNDCTTVDNNFSGGTLACLASCSDWDTTGCELTASCGNHTAESGETCDGTDLNGEDCASLGQGFLDGTLACAPDCQGWDTAGCTHRVGCGNGVIDPGETCDPPSSCPTWCDNDDLCTADSLEGEALSCDATCIHSPITICANGDGCCPDGCTYAEDSDCSAPPSKKGCGCRAGGGDLPAPVVPLILLALAWVGRRRNRRRR